jgi:ABC-2 type transport system permease protein
MTGTHCVQVMLGELRARLRDRTLIVIALVAPVVFATITSLAFASFDHPQPVRLVLTVDSADPAANGLVRAIVDSPRLRKVAIVTVAPSGPTVRARIRAGAADAGIILPAGSRLGRGGVPHLGGVAEILQTQQKPIAAGVAEAVLQQVGGEEWLNRVVLATLGAHGSSRSLVPRNPVTLTDVQASSRTLSAATYYGSSMAIVFLLFTVTPMAKSLWAERLNNTLARLLSSGVHRWAIVAGKALAAQVTGTASVATVWLVTSLAFHADWGDPGAVALLITVTVAATVALSFGIAALIRTEESMDGLVGTVTFVLVLAGGNFVAPADLPAALRQVGLFTPNGWALRGFLDLATATGGVSLIAAPVLALLAFTAGLWLVVAARLRTLVSP